MDDLSATERILNAIESTNVGLWSFNIDTKESWYSSTWKRMLGLPAEYPDRWNTFYDRVHPDDRGTVTEQIKKHINADGDDDYYQCEFSIRHANGKYIRVLSFGRLNRTTREFAGSHIDVSQAPDQRLFQALIDQVPAIIFVKDDKFKFRFVNKTFLETFKDEFPRGFEIIGKTDQELFPNVDEVDAFRADDLSVLKNNEAIEISKETLTLASGRVLILATKKAPFDDPRTHGRCVLGVATDISTLEVLLSDFVNAINEIEKASTVESCCQTAGEHLEVLGFSEYMITLLTSNGNQIDRMLIRMVVAAESSFASIPEMTFQDDELLTKLESNEGPFLYSAKKLPQGNWQLVVPVATQEAVIGAIHIEQTGKESVDEDRIRMLNSIGKSIGLVIGRIRNLERIEELKSEYEQSLRLLAFSSGAVSIAHELNHAISNFAIEITKAEKNASIRGNEGALDFMKKARLMAEACTELTEARISEAKQIDRETSERIAVDMFLQEIIQELLGKAKKWNCKLRSTVHDHELVIDIQTNKLREILNCLINNSIEFNARNVHVSAYVDESHGREVVFAVADDGSGIPEHNYTDIFRVGFSSGKPKTGHGLGLTLAKYAAQLLGGSLKLVSGGRAVGEDQTVFCVRLPSNLVVKMGVK